MRKNNNANALTPSVAGVAPGMAGFGWMLAALLGAWAGCQKGGVAPGVSSERAPSSSSVTKGAEAAEAAPYFKEYALSHPGSGPAILAVDDEDAIWVALAKDAKLARLSNGSVELFPFAPESRPVGLALAHRGNPQQGALWVAASYDNKIIRFDPVTRERREFKLPGENNWPFNVALGPDGSVWFTQRFTGQVGRLDPASGAVKNYPLPNRACGPAGLAVDGRSGRVWFTEGFSDTIGNLDPASGAIREWHLSTESTGIVSGPAGLALDAEGGVWFAKLEGKIGHLAPGAERAEIREVPKEARRPAAIAVAPSGDVWTLALDGNLALRYRPKAGTFTTFPLPTGSPDAEPSVPPLARSSRPFGIGFDRQGNLWFTEQYTGQLGVLDLAPPSIEIVSPARVVEGGRTLLTTRIHDRVAGGERVEVTIDGTPFTAVRGSLELIGLRPGPHRLSVRATDAAGFSAVAESKFEYRPGRFALQYAIERLTPVSAAGEKSKQELARLVELLGEQDMRDGLGRIGERLAACRACFAPFPVAAYQALLEFEQAYSASQVEVRVLDQPPYFDRKEVALRRGDSISWRYDAPNSGHSISTRIHTIRIEADGKPVHLGALKAGQRFAFKFEGEGRFLAKDLDQQGAVLAVNVGKQ